MTKKPINKITSFQKLCSSSWFTATRSFLTGDCKQIAFMPGCALAAYSPDLVISVYQHLAKSFIGLGILDQCCAKPSYYLKDKTTFNKYYASFYHEIEKHKITSIITACPNCLVNIKENSPEINTFSLYNILSEIGVPNKNCSGLLSASLHDPCPMKNSPDVQESVRSILNTVNFKFSEFDQNRSKTICCGSGGMLELIDKDRAAMLMKKRASQSKSDLIISYCQSCVDALSKGGKKSLHLLDLLFQDNVRARIERTPKGTWKRWLNRYKLQNLINKLPKK